MQGYQLSERGREMILRYQNRKLAANIVAGIIFVMVMIGMLLLLQRHMFLFTAFLLSWFIGVLAGYFAWRLAKCAFQTDYQKILTEEGDPKLFLEVHHGMMRLANRNQQMHNRSMLITAFAYISMGQFTDALSCLSAQYMNPETLNSREYLVFLELQFKAFYGMGNWKEIRSGFAQFKQAIEEFQENTHFSKMIVWSEELYEDVRLMIMNYDVYTTEGRGFIADMLSELYARLSEPMSPMRKAYVYFQIGNKELAAEQYSRALEAYEHVIKLGNQLYIAEIAREKVRMIRERDKDIGLLQDAEIYAVRTLFTQTPQKDITEEEIRNNIIFVLRENEKPAGIVRLTNEMKLGEMIMNSEYDTDKNEFRLLAEMKRRGYVAEIA